MFVIYVGVNLQTTKKNIAIKSIFKRRMMTSILSAKKVRYDLKATLPHLGFTVEEKPTRQCSYDVAYRVAKCKKLHTFAEELV